MLLCTMTPWRERERDSARPDWVCPQSNHLGLPQGCSHLDEQIYLQKKSCWHLIPFSQSSEPTTEARFHLISAISILTHLAKFICWPGEWGVSSPTQCSTQINLSLITKSVYKLFNISGFFPLITMTEIWGRPINLQKDGCPRIEPCRTLESAIDSICFCPQK